MSFQNVQQGIEAIRAGNHEEGARLLRIALKDTQLTGSLRAVALMWLAETSGDYDFRKSCYEQALAADPDNPDVQNRYSALLMTPPPPPVAGYAAGPGHTPPHGQPPVQQGGQPQGWGPAPSDSRPYQPVPPPYEPPTYPADSRPLPPYQQASGGQQYMEFGLRAVGISGGPSGPGTGFFIMREGIIVTTRHVVGGQENIIVELPGQQMAGRVLRSYPEFDLAFIQVSLHIGQTLTISPSQTLMENTPIAAFSASGRSYTSLRRPTEAALPQHWFPTKIHRSELDDAGGLPVFDDRNYLVGMLTLNAARSSGFVFGLHISMIQRLLEHYITEMRSGGQQRIYCPSCGYISQAAMVGGFYCEVCGSVLSFAMERPRFPQPGEQILRLYGENTVSPCPNCRARVGFYNGVCLRCSHTIQSNRR